jgi:type 1 glutamine amidotransferase
MTVHRRVNRRGFLHGLGVAAGAGVWSGVASEAAPQRTSYGPGTERPRVLALIGDRYHNADYIRVALARLFDGLRLPVDYTIDYAAISADLLRNYQLFVCFRDGMIWPKGYLEPSGYAYARQLEDPEGWPKEEPQPWITEEQGRALKEFVLAGNGFYALHNSSNISLYSKNFREVMGGAYVGHPPLRPFKVRVVNKEHPVAKGIADFTVNDEQHYVIYDKAATDIILRSENLDGLGYENLGTQAIAGWAYDYGKGRVVFTAVGHTIHALWQAEYFKLQQNAVCWLLRMA